MSRATCMRRPRPPGLCGSRRQSTGVQVFLRSAAAGGEVRGQSGDGRELPGQRGRERPAEQFLEVAGEIDRMKRIEAVVEKLQIALDVRGGNVGVAH